MQITTKILGVAVVAVFLASVISERLASRDPVLSGAKEFASHAPEVIAAAGLVESVRPVGLTTRQPSSEHAASSRQYRLAIAGLQGSVNATVKAIRSDPGGPWNYQVVSVTPASPR